MTTPRGRPMPTNSGDHRSALRQPRVTWEPYVEGSRAVEVMDLVRAIARQLRSEDSRLPTDYGLTRGRAGTALALRYLSRVLEDRSLEEVSHRYWSEALDRMAVAEPRPSLYAGFTGVAWVAAHLSQPGPERVSGEVFEEIDAALLDLLSESRIDEFDLVSGLVGIGVYALERWPAVEARLILEHIVSEIEARSSRMEHGLAWHTPRERIAHRFRDSWSAGYFNLGLAHGVPGVIALLAGIWSLGICRDRTDRILTAAVEWLRSTEAADDTQGRFPSWVMGSTTHRSARLAWCYGDLGVAVALALAGTYRERNEWVEWAAEIGEQCSQRTADKAAVHDHGFCHGASGVAHLFARLALHTGRRVFLDSAGRWVDRALAMKVPGEGISGVYALRPPVLGVDSTELSPACRLADWGLLTGALGVALVLASAVTRIDPAWDRVFLCSPVVTGGPIGVACR